MARLGTYTGRSMSESYKHLKITESEWAAFCHSGSRTRVKRSETLEKSRAT